MPCRLLHGASANLAAYVEGQLTIPDTLRLGANFTAHSYKGETLEILPSIPDSFFPASLLPGWCCTLPTSLEPNLGHHNFLFFPLSLGISITLVTFKLAIPTSLLGICIPMMLQGGVSMILMPKSDLEIPQQESILRIPSDFFIHHHTTYSDLCSEQNQESNRLE